MKKEEPKKERDLCRGWRKIKPRPSDAVHIYAVQSISSLDIIRFLLAQSLQLGRPWVQKNFHNIVYPTFCNWNHIRSWLNFTLYLLENNMCKAEWRTFVLFFFFHVLPQSPELNLKWKCNTSFFFSFFKTVLEKSILKCSLYSHSET